MDGEEREDGWKGDGRWKVGWIGKGGGVDGIGWTVDGDEWRKGDGWVGMNGE